MSEKIRIPTIDDFIEVTLDEMQESYNLAMDIAIAETFYLVSTTVKFGLYRAEIYSALAELREAQDKK